MIASDRARPPPRSLWRLGTPLLAQEPHRGGVAERAERPAAEAAARQGRAARRPRRPSRRLPPDSITQHSLELPGRTPALHRDRGLAAARRSRAASCRPRSASPPTRSTAPSPARARSPSRSTAGRARLRPISISACSGRGGCRSTDRRSAPRRRRRSCPMPRPGSTSPTSSSSIRSIPATAAPSARAEDIRNRYFIVEGDVGTLSAVITRWLRRTTACLAEILRRRELWRLPRAAASPTSCRRTIGVGLNGIVLLSPVLDFGWFSQPRHAPWVHAVAAAVLCRRRAWRRRARSPAKRCARPRRYAAGDYLVDLTARAAGRGGGRAGRRAGRGAHRARPRRWCERRPGASTPAPSQREVAPRPTAAIVSAYDAGVSGLRPGPDRAARDGDDPVLDRDDGAADQRDRRPSLADAELEGAGPALQPAQRRRERRLALGPRPRPAGSRCRAAPGAGARRRAPACWSRTASPISSRPISRSELLLRQLPPRLGRRASASRPIPAATCSTPATRRGRPSAEDVERLFGEALASAPARAEKRRAQASTSGRRVVEPHRALKTGAFEHENALQVSFAMPASSACWQPLHVRADGSRQRARPSSTPDGVP